MFGKHFNALVVCLGLVACSAQSEPLRQVEPRPAPGPDAVSETPPTEQARTDEPPVREDPGGSSGTEGTIAPCETVAKQLATLETRGVAVGFSGAELLALANQQSEVSIHWPARDSGPSLGASSTKLRVHVAARGETATEHVCSDPAFPEKYRPKPRLELPVEVMLQTDDGVLDASIPTVLSAESLEEAKLETLTLAPEAVGGTLGDAVAGFYNDNPEDLLIEVFFGLGGTYGWVGGPFSQNIKRACAYTAYAYWPADAACWPERSGAPIDDLDVMEPHLARVNQSFDSVWSDRTRTQLTFEATLAGDATCEAHGEVSHRVQLRVVSDDGRIDFNLPAMLSGGPQSIDPWPAHLRDVEPFSLNLMGSIALDAHALEAQLGFTDSSVRAAIVSVWLSSPSGVRDPALSGALRIVPIDRTGFAEPLPTVELPGGDSEHCFSSTYRTRVLWADLTLP